MGGTGVVDRFLDVFTRYIDSGFGLLGGEVAFIATTLIVIDVTLAALFWTWGEGDDILARLIKKTLFVGVFAYIIGNWNSLARIVFESFAGLGLKASGTGFTAAELLQPGRVAQVGLEAGQPILESISDLMGWIAFFENFIQIACLLFAWVLVILAFFILAIQLFITLIEFKLATLAGFVLIPFGLFGKTAFMAERVLGLVISSDVKVLVLAVIVGIGSTLFDEFRTGFGGAQPTIEDAMAVALASLCLLGVGIFGPSIANGIVSGGPALAAGGALVGGAAAARLGAGAVAGAVGGATRGAAFTSGAANSAYSLGSAGKTGAAAAAGGAAGVGRAAVGAALSPLRKAAASLKDSYRSGGRAAVTATGGAISGGASQAPEASSGRPSWATAMKRRQTMTHGATVVAHTLRSGDGGGGGASVDVSQKD